jgi:ADP-sugar diphosphatase
MYMGGHVYTMATILIIGHAGHGKDSVAAVLAAASGATYTSSSRAALQDVFEKMCYEHKYETAEECFVDRVNHRATWFDIIAGINKDDPATLTKRILAKHSIYVGMRSRREFSAARHLFSKIIWVDASARLPVEPQSSMELTPSDADVIIDNNGTCAATTKLITTLHTLHPRRGAGVSPRDFKIAVSSHKFKRWVDSIQKSRMNITSISVAYAASFGTRAGFMMLDTYITDPARNNVSIPGKVFIRGDSVACLIVLRSPDYEATVLVRQFRVPIAANIDEIPAGMMDERANFKFAMGVELREETGICVAADNMTYVSTIHPSAGGCDEAVGIHYTVVDMSRADIEALHGRVTGNPDEREHITLQVVPLSYETIMATGDPKAITAYFAYYQSKGVRTSSQ